MRQIHAITISTFPTCFLDSSVSRGKNRRTHSCGKIKPFMKFCGSVDRIISIPITGGHGIFFHINRHDGRDVGKFILLFDSRSAELIKRKRLRIELSLEKVQALGEKLYKVSIRHFLNLPVTFLIIKASISLPKTHRIKLKHDTIKIIITITYIFHNLE